MAERDLVPMMRSPVAQSGTFLDDSWAVIDQSGWRDEAWRANVRSPTPLAQRSPRAQMSGQLPGQPAVPWPVDGLKDRFVADMPGLLLWLGFANPEADLFRTPIQNELFLHQIAQRNVVADQAAAGAPSFLAGASVRKDSVVFSAVMSARVAAELPADRRRGTTNPPGNLSHRQALTAEDGEPFSLTA